SRSWHLRLFDARDGGLVHVSGGVKRWHDRNLASMQLRSLVLRAGVTVETEKGGAPVFGNQDAIAQRSSPGLVSNRVSRHTVEHDAAALASRRKPTHPSPSARQFRILLNEIAPSHP